MEITWEFLAERIYLAQLQGRRVYLCGNGGSAANAMHIANDWLAIGIRAIALTNLSTITAIANDHGYHRVFANQLAVYAESGDILVVLTGSGISGNILEALKEANARGLDTYAITGLPGAVVELAHGSVISFAQMQDAEEQQLALGHYVVKHIQNRPHSI